MKTIYAYWIPTPDSKYTNFGDILTPYILNKFNINAVYEKDTPQLYGIGSLLHMMPLDYKGHIWTSGMMYNTHRINIHTSYNKWLSLIHIVEMDETTIVIRYHVF